MRILKRSGRSSTKYNVNFTFPYSSIEVRFTLREVHTFILLLCLTVVGACAHRPPTPTAPAREISTYELLSALRSRAEYWRTYQARLRFHTETTKGKNRFQAFVSAKLPDELRLEATNPFGQVAGLLVMNPNGSLLYIPSERVAYSALQAQSLINYFLGVSIPPELFGYVLVGSAPPSQLNETFQAISTPTSLRATSRDPRRNVTFVWEFSKEPFSLNSFAVEGGQQRYTIRYEPPVELSLPETLPKNILFSSPEWKMEVGLLHAEQLPDLPDSQFLPVMPAGVRRVDLDRQR